MPALTEQQIKDALGTRLLQPQEVSSDGVTVTNNKITDFIEAAKFAAANPVTVDPFARISIRQVRIGQECTDNG